MDNELKFVEFVYCEKCKHKNVPEADDPCDFCLTVAARPNTRIPINFEKKED